MVLWTADSEERKVAMIAKEVTKKQQDCEEDLVKAEPALIAAQVMCLSISIGQSCYW